MARKNFVDTVENWQIHYCTRGLSRVACRVCRVEVTIFTASRYQWCFPDADGGIGGISLAHAWSMRRKAHALPAVCMWLSEYNMECGDRLYTWESDVCTRQILTYKDDPHKTAASLKPGFNTAERRTRRGEKHFFSQTNYYYMYKPIRQRKNWDIMQNKKKCVIGSIITASDEEKNEKKPYANEQLW